ncbi:MAG: hypothetical protein WC556_14320 [Candidatus Methanoperedens sp.]
MNLKNIRHLDWWVALVGWVVAIMGFNPHWMLIPYTLFGILLFIWRIKSIYDTKMEHSEHLVKDFQNSEVTFNPYLKDGLKLEVKPLYSKEINEHLEDDAYKDIKENIKRRDSYIKLHNEELKEFYGDLSGNIIKGITEQRDIIEPNILKCISNNYQSLESIPLKIYSHDGFHDLICSYNNTIWVESNDKNELEEFKKESIRIFDDAIQRKFKFELLLCYHTKIQAYQSCINRELNRIIDEIKTGTTPLKGKCTKYSKEDSFGRYVWAAYVQINTIEYKVVNLWQYIKK